MMTTHEVHDRCIASDDNQRTEWANEGIPENVIDVAIQASRHNQEGVASSLLSTDREMPLSARIQSAQQIASGNILNLVNALSDQYKAEL